VLESSPAGMVFGKRGQAPGETFIAQVAMFEMAATTAAEELEAWVKTAVEKDTDPGRFDVQQMSLKYSSERSYPCVRYQSVATDKAPRRPYPPLLLESEGLYCRHPLRQDAGFSAVYSHRGRNRHPGLRSEAEAFIQGVQVPPQ